MFLAPTFALNYGLSFAALTAAIVHIILFHRKEIWHRFKASRNQEPDIHLTLMKKYPEAPEWWYAGLFIVSIALGLGCVLGYDSQLPCMRSDLYPPVVTLTNTYPRVGILCVFDYCSYFHCKFFPE